MKYLVLAAFVLLVGSVGASAQELFPIQQSQVTGGGGGSGCTKPDTGLGASFGLSCQSAMSDDCIGNGTMDPTKWFSDGQYAGIVQSGGACRLFLTGANGTETGVVGIASINRTPPTDGEWSMEIRFRFVLPFYWGSVVDNWTFACNSATQPYTCYSSKVNVPEVDMNETYSDRQFAGNNLWNGTSYGPGCNTNSYFSGIGPEVFDGNWHTWTVHVSGSAGTITWYMDKQLQNVATNCSPYQFNPSLSGFGQGYEEVFSTYCNATQTGGSPNCNTASSYTTEEDIDYIHMSY